MLYSSTLEDNSSRQKCTLALMLAFMWNRKATVDSGFH
nr:hypothetical protein [Klebsiella michiganensis]